jgi:hypothetical protein
MLTAGSLGNATSALAFGAFLGYRLVDPPFAIAIAANCLGALLWLKIDREGIDRSCPEVAFRTF